MIAVCFVCWGNICRSPSAEIVFRHRVSEAGLDDQIHIDSAGTGAWNLGCEPDPRAVAEGRRRGYEPSGIARQFDAHDFGKFDFVIAMDRSNVKNLESIAPDEASRQKIRLLRTFELEAPPFAEVDDPYYGGEEGFATMFDHIESACEGLLDYLVEMYHLEPR